ncbi:MAG: hypothetical protein O7G30_00910, partial [Proteobacteria bacterium]|nr:hypothetical protein [Pseudomonadota bacterium]
MTGAARRLLSVACLGALALALASSASRAAEEEKRRQSYTVSEPVYKRINEAIEQLGEERFVEAHATLTALSRRSLNPHEQALVYQIYGFVEHSLENEAKAIEYFLKCLALDALPAAAQLNLRFNLSQLYMAEGRFAEATR